MISPPIPAGSPMVSTRGRRIGRQRRSRPDVQERCPAQVAELTAADRREPLLAQPPLDLLALFGRLLLGALAHHQHQKAVGGANRRRDLADGQRLDQRPQLRRQLLKSTGPMFLVIAEGTWRLRSARFGATVRHLR